MYVHTYVHAYVHTYICTCVHMYMHMYIHAYIRTYVRTYMRMYIHAYIHTCICTYRMYMDHLYIRCRSRCHPVNGSGRLPRTLHPPSLVTPALRPLMLFTPAHRTRASQKNSTGMHTGATYSQVQSSHALM